MGFSIEAKDEPSVYWTGDTVLYPAVEEIIRTTDPDVIVIHPCGALWEGDPIAMDAEQAITVCKASPRATVVATHLGALNHTTVSRDDLRRQSTLQGIASEQLRIPQDGECLEFGVR